MAENLHLIQSISQTSNSVTKFFTQEERFFFSFLTTEFVENLRVYYLN